MKKGERYATLHVMHLILGYTQKKHTRLEKVVVAGNRPDLAEQWLCCDHVQWISVSQLLLMGLKSPSPTTEFENFNTQSIHATFSQVDLVVLSLKEKGRC